MQAPNTIAVCETRRRSSGQVGECPSRTVGTIWAAHSRATVSHYISYHSLIVSDLPTHVPMMRWAFDDSAYSYWHHGTYRAAIVLSRPFLFITLTCDPAVAFHSLTSTTSTHRLKGVARWPVTITTTNRLRQFRNLGSPPTHDCSFIAEMADSIPGRPASSEPPCYNCGMRGHLFTACPEPTRELPA